ncbi:right-handed parallel beta-helix repeat-containing protein, partial [bacterium]|nr:right-handed parallel beta-helix repeat-containing protein [bacterium]
MSTYSKIFIAIIAITLGCHQLSYAVLEPVDQDWINDRLADGDHSFTFEADQEGQYEGYNITEDISIPQGENCAGDFTYTIEFEPGADIYFDSGTSLTITTNGDGVGRIVAEGEDEDMVTFTSSEGFPVAGDWGGIIIETDPGEESPNIIDYCEISYAGMDVNANRHAIYINDACVEVKNSIICHNGFPTGGGRTAGTGILIEGGDCDFTIEDNEIYHSSTPIWILGGETIEINEDYSITRNRMYSNTHHGIYIEAPFTGDITNNLVYDTGLDEWDSVLLNLDFRNTGLIANNVLDGTSPDSDFEGAVFGDMEEGEWSPNFINNIIVNCETAVVGVGDEESVVNYNFIDNCAAAFEQCEEGIGCLVNEDDPEFVDDDNGDYHLDWNSSAIDIGRNWLNVSGDDLLTDLNFTYNDMGAYGGPTADPEMAGIFFGEVVDGTHHVETDGTVWYNYTLTVDDGITLEFDDDTGLQIFGDLIVTGDFGGSGVVFKKYVEAEDWDGLNFYGGGHNSSIEYAEIKDAYWDGITISATYVPLISNCLIHDNGRRGIFIWWADDGTTTISDCVIYQNNEYGIYIGVDGGPAAMVIIEDCEIYENDYGLFIVDTPFISTDNLFTENELYGVFVCSWTTATMYGD